MLVTLIISLLVMGLAMSVASVGLILRQRGAPSRVRRAKQFHQTHQGGVPRIGGLALAIPFAILYLYSLAFPASGLALNKAEHVLALTSLSMFGLGLWDDFKPLGAKVKLAGQVLIALSAWYFGLRVELFKNPIAGVTYSLGSWSALVTVVWIVALTNLINLIDGIDGLAGGVGLMLMGLLAYTSFNGGMPFAFLASVTMLGAILGFLRFNFPPAKIYMGDGGAYFLGCLISLLSLENSHKGTVIGALIAPLFALGLPIADTSLAILRRALKGLPIFRADRKHLHHRLIDSGLGKRNAVLLLYGVSSLFLIMAVVLFATEGRAMGILIGATFILILFSLRSLAFSKQWLTPAKIIGDSVAMRKETRYALTLSSWLVLEAERAPSLLSLWEDFCFLCAKLRFSKITLCFRDGAISERDLGGIDSGELQTISQTYEVHFGDIKQICFEADSLEMSPKMLDHLSELACEAWVSALGKCQENDDVSVDLSPDHFRPPSSSPNPGTVSPVFIAARAKSSA